MFGFGKLAKTTDKVIGSLDLLFLRYRPEGGLPKKVWEDHYCFGYIVGASSLLSKVHGGRNFGGEDLGKLLMRVFENYLPGEGFLQIQRSNQLMGQRERSFLIGMDMGAKSVQILFAPESIA